jgi:hypothetical protein
MSSIVSGNEVTKSFEMVLENLSDKEQMVIEKRI